MTDAAGREAGEAVEWLVDPYSGAARGRAFGAWVAIFLIGGAFALLSRQPVLGLVAALVVFVRLHERLLPMRFALSGEGVRGMRINPGYGMALAPWTAVLDAMLYADGFVLRYRAANGGPRWMRVRLPDDPALRVRAVALVNARLAYPRGGA